MTEFQSTWELHTPFEVNTVIAAAAADLADLAELAGYVGVAEPVWTIADGVLTGRQEMTRVYAPGPPWESRHGMADGVEITGLWPLPAPVVVPDCVPLVVMPADLGEAA